MNKNFSLIGCAGYVAWRHIKAIKDTQNNLICAVDPHDSVGILDRYFDDVSYFSEYERYSRYVEKLKKHQNHRINYVSICSPNYLHEYHIKDALRIGANAICEKPVVLNPSYIDFLKEVEEETGKKVYTVLQLRYKSELIDLKNEIEKWDKDTKMEVTLTYITSRGPWYNHSWKGDLDKSGGLATNIGIHLFDVLIWLFGNVESHELHVSEQNRVSGYIETQKANIKWFLSIEKNDLLPKITDDENSDIEPNKNFRSFKVNGNEIDFSGKIDQLHTTVYEHIFNGKGLTLDEAKPAIVLAHEIRNMKPIGLNHNSHPDIK